MTSLQPSRPAPPVAAKRPRIDSLHGDRRVDDYFWMRERDNPEVLAHLKAENDYTEAMTAHTAPLQAALYDEMLGHIKQTDSTVPYPLGEYLYYARTEEGKQYPIYCRRRGAHGAEEITLDPNVLAQGHDFLGVGAYAVSDDGRLLAYSLDTTGYRQYTLFVKDLSSGALLAGSVERVGDVLWSTDNRTLFYTTEDELTKRSNRLYRHEAGSAQGVLLYEEGDELYDLGAYRSRDRAFVFAISESKRETEVRALPAGSPSGELRLLLAREPEHKYYVDHRAGAWYIRTNDGAKNYRIVTAPADRPEKSQWTELIAYDPAVKVEDLDLFADFMVVWERAAGLERLRVHEFGAGTSHQIAFPEPAYAIFGAPNMEFSTAKFRYSYQSLVTPSSVFEYDVHGGASTLLKETEVPGGFARSNYVSERIFATAPDGVEVPIALVYRSGVKRDGSAPLVLYGYGSYGLSMPDTFSPARLALLDRGVVYAIAHIRGGGELGEEWREAGRMKTKRTTFSDFIACAEQVIARGYTARDRLAILGGSAGGLLLGVVANERPELFQAVVSKVPFVDVLNTMLDASLPLTTGEYQEWGNPNEREAYEYIKSYSPYDNVAAQHYPATLVEVALNDSQVPYWEGAKLVAKMRDCKVGNSALLLRVNLGAGHGGASGRYDALKETAFDYAFILDHIAGGAAAS